MTTNPNQGPRPDPADSYGGYGGYRPSNSVDDPYGTNQPGGSQHSDPNYVYGQRSQGQQSSDSQTQQQQFNYEPPESVLRRQGGSSGFSAPFTSAASQGSIEKEDRKSAFYSYLGFCFTGIVFFFFSKKKRPFVRFHAAQSIVLFVPIAAILVVLKVVSIITLIPFIGWILSPVISLLTFIVVAPAFILWIILMVLSYQGVRVKLPIVGHYAEAMVARFSSEKRTV